jgi:flagellar biosynthesis protein FliQ
VTLTFIPKILVVSLALVVALPWMIQKLLDFMIMLMHQIPAIVT